MESKGLHSPDNPSSQFQSSLDFSISQGQQDPSSPSPRVDMSPATDPPLPPPPPPSSSPSVASSSPSIMTRPRALTHAPNSSAPPPLSFLRNRSVTISNPQDTDPSLASSSASTSSSTSTATSPTRTTTTTTTSSAHPHEGREKRKRSRVTPEQLSHLERLFAMDRSPTAAKRKEISELLGMQERQTQIWFQNRRAKAKTMEGKSKLGFHDSPHSGGDSPPPGTPSDYTHLPHEIDLHSLIHEDDPAVTFLPCTDLTIGSWRRISATLGQHDLLAYVSYLKQSFMWFIFSNGYGFKMEIPFDSITNTTFTSTAVGQAIASFYLSRPPTFYLETGASPTDNNTATAASPVSKLWKKCADWTEGQQASKILRHDLVGAPGPLMSALKSLHSLPSSSSSSASASSSSTSTSTATTSPTTAAIIAPRLSTMHIPQPPLTTIDTSNSFTFQLNAAHLAPHGRKRSSSGPPNYSLLGAGSQATPSASTSSPTDESIYSTRAGSFSSSGSSQFGPNTSSSSRSLAFANPYPPVSFFRSFPNASSSSSSATNTATATNTSSCSAPPPPSSSSASSSSSSSSSHPHMSSSTAMSVPVTSPILDYTSVPISHAIAPRPYSASSMSLPDHHQLHHHHHPHHHHPHHLHQQQQLSRYATPYDHSASLSQHHIPHLPHAHHEPYAPTATTSSPSSSMPLGVGSIFRPTSPPLLTAAFDPSTLHRGSSSSSSSTNPVHQQQQHILDIDADMVVSGSTADDMTSDDSMLLQMELDMVQFASGLTHHHTPFDSSTLTEHPPS